VPLAAHEVQLLTALGSERALSELAEAAGVDIPTMTDAASALYARLGLRGRAEAAAVALRSGLA
jgi:DNA-binding CsgD family transcriptional regulator